MNISPLLRIDETFSHMNRKVNIIENKTIGNDCVWTLNSCELFNDFHWAIKYGLITKQKLFWEQNKEDVYWLRPMLLSSLWKDIKYLKNIFIVSAADEWEKRQNSKKNNFSFTD